MILKQRTWNKIVRRLRENEKPGKSIFSHADREQKLLVVAIIVVLAVACLKLFQSGIQKFNSWQEIDQLMESHEMILRLKPSIDQALEEQKIAQQNKSYDKKNLSNRVSAGRSGFSCKGLPGLDTEEREDIPDIEYVLLLSLELRRGK